MKRFIIVVLVLAAIGVGFYFGYIKVKTQSNPDISFIPISQIPTTDSIQFKYSISTSSVSSNVSSSQMQWSSNGNQHQKSAMQIKGSMPLKNIFSTILGQGGMAPTTIIASSNGNLPANFRPATMVVRQSNASIVKVNLDPAIENKNYDIELSFPFDESRDKVLDKVAADLNLTYSKNESTTAGYRITWQDPALQFPATMKPIRTVKQYSIDTAKSFQMQGNKIIGNFNFATSNQAGAIIGDFETIDIPAMIQSWGDGASYSSEEEAIQILRDKKGIEIKPTELNIIELEVKPL